VTTKRKFLFFLVAPALAIGGCGYCAYRGFQETYSIRTARDASPQDVSFLRLPPSASRIGYWRDGLNYCAEFDIPEDAFRSLFHKFHFDEISKPISVHLKPFGDPQVFPYHADTKPISITSGLSYHEQWSNGGGYNIIYDRSRSRAYYDFGKR
jgi:hypothetical protein